MIYYTIQPMHLDGRFFRHTIGVYNTHQEAVDRLLEAGYRQFKDILPYFMKEGAPGDRYYHITEITEDTF